MWSGLRGRCPADTPTCCFVENVHQCRVGSHADCEAFLGRVDVARSAPRGQHAVSPVAHRALVIYPATQTLSAEELQTKIVQMVNAEENKDSQWYRNIHEDIPLTDH